MLLRTSVFTPIQAAKFVQSDRSESEPKSSVFNIMAYTEIHEKQRAPFGT